METLSIYKVLLLLNLISKRPMTKQELMFEFEKRGYGLTKTCISNYIKTISANGFNVQISKNNSRESIYGIEKDKPRLCITPEEVKVIKDVKKLLYMEKNFDDIRKTMKLFYKCALFVEDEDIKDEFIDFGYYSTINWNIVKKLEYHCEQKNVITIDYILPKGGNKIFDFRVDYLRISDTSQRLYVHGVFKYAKNLSFLPVDRIFMVRKSLNSATNFELINNVFTYVVSMEAYKVQGLDIKEHIVEIGDNRVMIQRPMDSDFKIMQRLMHFCPGVYFISNDRIKKLYLEKLEIMQSYYEG